ncbi:MAG: type I DNA topoisomerase [Candidatus Electryonea clarkiae]|nr:type I DNA topoisomerase [Candidatus Electryonea clarkiae]MDP8286543.1 type I DNA topoisomerase [Candidatus Electryonea clarkiae]
MPTKLVIVESPAKVKTLLKYLGNNYSVKASMGHVRDLPQKDLAVDVENKFKPEYVIIPGKQKVVTALKKAAANVDEILIATDPDREGEAIGWHIAHILKNKNRKISRVTFNEITKKAVVDAINNQTEIDLNKVNAQQARRVLDRLVGYLVSEQLWKVLARGLSAGRVQSVALRMIVEREEEIEAFVPEEYWTITAQAEIKETASFRVKLAKINDKEAKVSDGETAARILAELKSFPASLFDVRSRINNQKPLPPFITSTLQQEAARRLYFAVKRTMMVAQRLYEGIELGEAGAVGLITYMRTDSVRVSKVATDAAREFIESQYGKEFLSPKLRVYGKKGRSQDAHEAIRPTSFEWTPEKVKQYLKPEQYRLYQLIWNRFLATQMADAKYESVTVDIASGLDENATGTKSKSGKKVPAYILRANGRNLLFSGFRRLWGEIETEDKDEDEEKSELPDIFFSHSGNKEVTPKDGTPASLSEIDGDQKFTLPPYRFSESMLVKALDENGIGRPSTYAQIISTLFDRKYIDREKKKLSPTELGRKVNSLLVKGFDEVFNTSFTAKMEEALDKVEDGEEWTETVRQFWEPFKEHIERFKSRKDELKKEAMVPLGRKCPECAEGELVERWGRFGKFITCDRFPKCKYTERTEENGGKAPEPESTGRTCPKCENGDLVIKKGRYGNFIACTNYPKCKHTEQIPGEEKKQAAGQANLPDISIPCPRKGCGGEIVSKRSRRGKIFYSCTNWKEKKCKVVFWDLPIESGCPSCKYPIRTIKGKNIVCPECKEKEPHGETDKNA